MTAPHFFAPDVAGDRVMLEGEEAHHAVRALRVRPGEAITVSDGRGTVVDVEVDEAGKRLAGRVTRRRTVERLPPDLHVFQALPKHGKLEVVVRKLTELGVARIGLFAAERSVPRWTAAKGAAQAARLAEVARQAAKQSRRAWLLEVDPPVPAEALTLPETTVALHEEASVRLRAALPGHAPRSLGLVVGPEGGFGEDEISFMRSRGATPVSLGPAILRTETAAIAATSIVLAHYGVLG